jgi:hypothetical protein
MTYLKYVLFYIHFNPQKHGLSADFRNYPHSSWGQYILKKSKGISVANAMEWFNLDFEEFIEFHKYYHDENKYKTYILEDE